MSILKNAYKKFLVFLKRLKLKNHNFTIISNNCCGEIMYNSLGERFNSPTINLFIKTEHYLDFLENLQIYLNAPVFDISNISEVKYPVGQIKISENQFVNLHFVHYKSFDEARKKWESVSGELNGLIYSFLWKPELKQLMSS